MCERLLAAECLSFAAVKRALARRHAAASAEPAPPPPPSGPSIRAIHEYQRFWETHSQTHSQTHPPEDTDDEHVYH